MPCRYALAGSPNARTVFYAHEVATMRRIVEEHAGHDTMFYNVLDKAMEKGKDIPAMKRNIGKIMS